MMDRPSLVKMLRRLRSVFDFVYAGCGCADTTAFAIAHEGVRWVGSYGTPSFCPIYKRPISQSPHHRSITWSLLSVWHITRAD